MIIVSGTLYVAADDRAAYLDDCREAVERARAAPGCLDFALSADLIEPGRINVYERWASDADLAAFRGSGPDAGQAARILRADVAKYRIATAEAP
ncbi:putative quinol monooxygenase [Streptomyces sp. G45]|uniref:putative quinol monooxygenase n=1 Tax=Streptomyces sp. G45 TaxID=3406627 RepID=UPI003C1C124A